MKWKYLRICGSSAQVIGFPEIPPKPPSQQAPGLLMNRQQPPTFSGSHGCSVGQPVGPAQPVLPKDIPRRTPPSRPAPPAPKPPTSQVWSCAAVLWVLFDGRFVLVKPPAPGELLGSTRTGPILCEHPIHEVFLRFGRK